MKFTITMKGITPLLMHNGRLCNPLDPAVKEIKKYTGKRKKTDDDHETIARLEHRASFYWDPDVGPYIPAENVGRMLQDAGKKLKLGRRVVESVLITSDVNPLAYNGPRDLDALYDDKNFVHTWPVKVGTSRTMRCRPMFRNWAVEAEGLFDDSLIDFSDLQNIVEIAGQVIGLGDWRPRYGRFEGSIKNGK